ncbi:MAG TPA: hypothetical protein VM074_10470 [Solimonas sp.]|nr:hypothetical protein [Solimonas sp.]
MSLAVAVVASLLAGCGDEAAFGSGGIPAQPRAAEDPLVIDLSGTDQPADLPTPLEGAMGVAGVQRIVDAVAAAASELGGAAGDLFPSKDNPCPDGGDASSDLSGSVSNPRIRMEFHGCVRGEVTLDGVATITCKELDGSDCVKADVALGDGDAVLYLRDAAAGRRRIFLLHGFAHVETDEPAQRLTVLADLQGELRALEAPTRFSFVTGGFGVDLHKVSEEQTEVRIEGLAGFGGGAEGAHCIRGRFDTQTPADPLILEGQLVRSGRLALHSPPPRPGAQQPEASFVDGGADVLGADGAREFYTEQELAGFCRLEG